MLNYKKMFAPWNENLGSTNENDSEILVLSENDISQALQIYLCSSNIAPPITDDWLSVL